MVGYPLAGLDPAVDRVALAADRDSQDWVLPGGCADRMEPAGRAAVLDRREAALDMAAAAGPAADCDEADAEQAVAERVVADLEVARSTSPAVADSIDYTHFHHKSYLTFIHSLFCFIYKDVPLSDSRSTLNSIFNPS